MNPELQERLNDLLDRDSTYPLAAYRALNKGLDYAVHLRRIPGHVTGQELSLGMAGYLKSEYGPFARMVLDGWNIRATIDFGRMVFNLIDAGLMGKQDSDSIEDFIDVYDFNEVFPVEVDWLQDVRTDLDLTSRSSGSLS